jgi:hypothetical protein
MCGRRDCTEAAGSEEFSDSEICSFQLCDGKERLYMHRNDESYRIIITFSLVSGC